MSTTKTKSELVRLGWLTELRRQGDRQCEGELFDGLKVCALGLLAEVSGLGRRANAVVARWSCYAPIGKRAGLSADQTQSVYEMNDSKHTFSEIADVVESWFSK